MTTPQIFRLLSAILLLTALTVIGSVYFASAEARHLWSDYDHLYMDVIDPILVGLHRLVTQTTASISSYDIPILPEHRITSLITSIQEALSETIVNSLHLVQMAASQMILNLNPVISAFSEVSSAWLLVCFLLAHTFRQRARVASLEKEKSIQCAYKQINEDRKKKDKCGKCVAKFAKKSSLVRHCFRPRTQYIHARILAAHH
jgi:hypothetical protein